MPRKRLSVLVRVPIPSTNLKLTIHLRLPFPYGRVLHFLHVFPPFSLILSDVFRWSSAPVSEQPPINCQVNAELKLNRAINEISEIAADLKS
jgi:hypothetical protein